MKIKQIIGEGVFDDLKALGQNQQTQAMDAMKQKLQSFKGAVSPQWYKNAAAEVAKKQSGMQVAALAGTWTDAWAKEFARLEQANAAPFTDEQYRGLLRSWLERATKINIDATALAGYVPVQSQQAVRNYFADHFIPKYLELQSNPVQFIPDGTTVDAVTQVGNKRSGERYTWSTARGRWADSRGSEVAAYSQLHQDLTQQSMQKAANNRIIGGAGASTI